MIDLLFKDHCGTIERMDAFNDVQLDLLLKELGDIAHTDAFGRVMDRYERLAFEQGFKVAVRLMSECMPPYPTPGACGEIG